MTFSDKRVAEAVNKGFIPAWINRGPGFRNVDFSTESWIFQGDLEAYPTKNICTFFLTPQGKVFYYVAGSYAPELFLQVLETASALGGAAAKGDPGAAAKIHLARAEACDELLERAREAGSTPDGWKGFVGDPKKAVLYRGLKHKHGPGCLGSLSSGWEYFAKLHRMWAEWKELPELEAVRYTYLYGNDFTEENEASTRIARQEPSPEPPKPLPPPPPRMARVAAQGKNDALGLGLPVLNPADVILK